MSIYIAHYRTVLLMRFVYQTVAFSMTLSVLEGHYGCADGLADEERVRGRNFATAARPGEGWHRFHAQNDNRGQRC